MRAGSNFWWHRCERYWENKLSCPYDSPKEGEPPDADPIPIHDREETKKRVPVEKQAEWVENPEFNEILEPIAKPPGTSAIAQPAAAVAPQPVSVPNPLPNRVASPVGKYTFQERVLDEGHRWESESVRQAQLVASASAQGGRASTGYLGNTSNAGRTSAYFLSNLTKGRNEPPTGLAEVMSEARVAESMAARSGKRSRRSGGSRRRAQREAVEEAESIVRGTAGGTGAKETARRRRAAKRAVAATAVTVAVAEYIRRSRRRPPGGIAGVGKNVQATLTGKPNPLFH